ncbi:hypothetical protein J1N35_006303 [Gossypium stocksii]|uniref:RNase H type-1 domain-containing protein n=1 Tax=Gossypium stocksii TaxID=47602 RepID=A0A9D3WH03_9ROSI|nr:hypothetical protein J1N35_006303 [Gossypium stocksii]
MVTSLVDIFQVEAKAMLEGLKLAWEWGFRQVELETDNALLLEILRSSFTCVNNVNNIAKVRLLHTWIAKDWQMKLRLLSRNGNKVVDCLAKEILNQLIILDELSIYVQRLLKIDVYHIMSDVIDRN